MSNTLESGIVVGTQGRVAVETPPSIRAAAQGFAWLQSTNPLASGRTVRLADITTVPATLVDPADFESGDSTIGELVMVPHHISQPFHMSHSDSNQGGSLEWLYASALEKFAQTIWGRIAAVLTEANYGTPVYSGAASGFSRGDIGTLRSAVQTARRSLILSTGLFNGIADSAPWPIPGFANVAEVSDWSTAGTGIQGFVADPTALVVLSGPAHPLPNDQSTRQSKVNLPGLNLSVTYTEWLARPERELWGSFDTVLGVCVGKAAYGKLLKVV